MKNKKILALMGVAMLSFSLLAGCGNKGAQADDADASVEDDLGEEGEVTVALDDPEAGNEGEDIDELAEGDEGDEEAYVDPNRETQTEVIDPENNVEFVFESLKEHGGELPDKAEMKDSDGDLDGARWESLKNYYGGNETDAQEELDELRQSEALSADLLKLIQPYYPQIARYFAKAGIKSYDMTKPFYVDEEEINYDLYTADYITYYLTVYLDESGKIQSFEMYEENTYEETDEEDVEGDDDGDDGIEFEVGDGDDGGLVIEEDDGADE